MEDYILNQWYFAPFWIANAIGFGKQAYENFKKMREDNAKILPALFWSTSSVCATGFTAVSVADGLEKLL